jgi:hypothetical protein
MGRESMIRRLSGNFLVMTCVGCAIAHAQETPLIVANVGPVNSAMAFDRDADLSGNPVAFRNEFADFETMNRAGNPFSPNRFSTDLRSSARFRAMDLATPLPLRSEEGDTLAAEFSFSASGERTGLGLDVEVAPRAQIDATRGGNNVARTGAEVRVGQNLVGRDQRGANVLPPAWYFFIGADNEALVWNVGDRKAMDGLTLRDQVTVGDLQAGVAWRAPLGAQFSLGLVEREMSYSGVGNTQSISITDRFAAFSFTMKR